VAAHASGASTDATEEYVEGPFAVELWPDLDELGQEMRCHFGVLHNLIVKAYPDTSRRRSAVSHLEAALSRCY
jgi:hypothetical protein